MGILDKELHLYEYRAMSLREQLALISEIESWERANPTILISARRYYFDDGKRVDVTLTKPENSKWKPYWYWYSVREWFNMYDPQIA